MCILRSLFLLSLLFLGLSFTNGKQDKYIRWKQGNKLVWEDFQGTLDTKLINNVSAQKDSVQIKGDTTVTFRYETEAYCYHQISFRSNYKGDTLRFVVETLFDKSKSWTKSNSDHILNHEQRHFDLAEICARHFRKCISDSVNSYNERSQKIMFERYANENTVAQKEYDSITNHSININEQLAYNTQIDSELNVLSNYASSQIKKYCPQPKRMRK